jgi:hypothetical protein
LFKFSGIARFASRVIIDNNYFVRNIFGIAPDAFDALASQIKVIKIDSNN